ncbi:LIC_20245 family lipoprotein [Leptospira alstonii]|uniref:Uncharacterized protein n=2 Tax=Leptospira alstonii TaxID=28452 RepID=M6CY57_9LEPT|nr:hypothetical protein [Leptospira alstonii]EMJ96624.1 hypothetical protein LEP1GSC194_4232 [Leptospira alstonii serovar Sichuan str. 79601]EQA78637.1 hypothetical protein LEP1GSC193_1620 [Leptospira alstonii serovar Pingchang str. 80-412]
MNKKVIYSIIIIFLTFSAYLFFFEEERSGVRDFSEGEKLKGGLSRNTVMREENSLFESGNFLDFPAAEESETWGASKAEATSFYSSLSVQEKERIRKEVIQKVKPLAERFPDNSLIPRELNKEQEEKRKKDEERMYDIRVALLEGREVAKSDMEFYLDSKIKKSNDMTEILEYGLKFFKDSRRNDSELKIVEERLSSLQKSREELIFAKKNLETE